MKNHYYYVCSGISFHLGFYLVSCLSLASMDRSVWVGGLILTWLGEWTSVCYRKYIKFKQNSLCYYLSLTHTDIGNRNTEQQKQTQVARSGGKCKSFSSKLFGVGQGWISFGLGFSGSQNSDSTQSLSESQSQSQSQFPNPRGWGEAGWPFLPRCILNSSGRRIWQQSILPPSWHTHTHTHTPSNTHTPPVCLRISFTESESESESVSNANLFPTKILQKSKTSSLQLPQTPDLTLAKRSFLGIEFT